MRENTNELLKKFNIRLTKALGQNFLTDNNIVRKIVDLAEITKNDCVIEIGPGTGVMTVELAKRAKNVVAIEIDKKLIPVLSYNLKEFSNVTLLNKDIMTVDIENIIKDFDDEYVKIVANLPYYITTPIIMKLLESWSHKITSMVFMIQKEVAERIVATPGTKAYGALSVAVQYYSKPKIMFSVSPNCFVPKPDVESSVIKIVLPSPISPLSQNRELVDEIERRETNKAAFFKTVKAAFGQRRKTLVNSLANSGYFLKNKDEIKKILSDMGLQKNQRGETLTIEQFVQLSQKMNNS